MTIAFLTIDEVIAVHSAAIDEFGGSHGLLNRAALESAVMRPQIGYYDALNEYAAALMESLALNHPFVDGNKRVAFFATNLFLEMNGQTIDCDGEEAYRHFMSLFDAGAFRYNELLAWLDAHTRPLPPQE